MKHLPWQDIRQESSELIKVAVPAIFAQLAQMALGVIDTLMAGNHSSLSLAAVGTGVNTFLIIFSLFFGLTFALNPMVAHFNGQGKFEQIGKVFQLGMFLAIIFGLITFILLNNIEPMLNAINVAPDLVETTSGYLSALSWGSISIFMFLALRSSNEGLFSTRAIMICSFLAIPFNVLFNYWFIFGGFGVPAMGAVGVGYATSLVWTLLFLFLLIFTYRHKPYKNLNIFKNIQLPRKPLVKEFFQVGTPLAIGILMEVAMFGLIGVAIARFGIELTGAHQVAMNLASLAFMIPLGLSVAITARVGYWMGKQQHRQMRLSGYCGIGISLLFQTLSVSIMLLFRYQLVGFYTDDLMIIEIAASLLFLAAIFQFSDGLQVNAAGALRGMKDTTVPMMYMAISYWIFGFPIGYYLAEKKEMLVQGYWIGIICGLTVAAVLLLGRWKHKSKQLVSPAALT
ncbi:MAG: MATE family efflux transporter [Kangiellaceae bacterium]|nr:MATE family efflux transporter [Kangiellaceae bacterium]